MKTLAELTTEIKKLEHERNALVKRMSSPPAGLGAAAEFLLLSHKGRSAEAAKDPGTCSTSSLQMHLEQVADPDSWVHSSLVNWASIGLE